MNVKCLVNGTREVIFNGDCVLCTLPLGVLKRSIRNRSNAPSFHPELPRWKIDAINSLGFGNVNKVKDYLIFQFTSRIIPFKFTDTIITKA